MNILLILKNWPFVFIRFACVIECTVTLKLMLVHVVYVGVFVPYVLSCDNIVIMLCLDRADFLPLYNIIILCSQSMMVELIAVREYHS